MTLSDLRAMVDAAIAAHGPNQHVYTHDIGSGQCDEPVLLVWQAEYKGPPVDPAWQSEAATDLYVTHHPERRDPAKLRKVVTL